MGALTNNRKRRDDYYNFNYKFPSLCSLDLDHGIDSHISKKPKTSSYLSPERPVSSKSAAARISQYPEPVNRFKRAVHAPCRVVKFGFGASFKRESKLSSAGAGQKEGFVDVMRSFPSFNNDQLKNLTLDTSPQWTKDKEVIDIDAEFDRDDVSEYCTGVVEVLEDGREGPSASLEHASHETSEVARDSQKLEGNAAEHIFRPTSTGVSDLTMVNLKVDNADLLSLNWKLDALGLPTHRKLLETAERRNSKLNSLKFQIELNEKRRANLQSLYPVKKPQEEVMLEDALHEPFVPLTEEEEAEVSRAFSNSNRRRVLVTHEKANIQITGEYFQCLRPGAWLNDEIINVYLELLKERERREPKKFLKCHFCNTFFYKKLMSGKAGYDFKSVRRWTTQRKLGYCLHECDKIFVPIHKEVHWCLAIINKKDRKFQYLDSLGGFDGDVLKVLARYFVDEVKDKNGEYIDLSSWTQEVVEDLPEQENGWDCGMFMIKYADFYSRGLGLCFSQEHMPYFRLRTAKEILRLKAD